MSFDENTLTMNVGSRDWLEVTKDKDMRVQGYLSPAGKIDIVTEFLEQSTQFTVTSSETPAPASREYESARLTEEFNKAYDEEARQEDEEFVKNLKRYHRRRFSDEW